MKRYIIILLSVFLFTGCASSKITTWWKAPGNTVQTYHKILVLGLIRSADRSLQQHMEDHMVGDLADVGYQAISSLQEYGPKAFDKMDEAQALAKIKGSNVDAVITIVLLKKEKVRTYVHQDIYYPPYSFYYNRFWTYRIELSGRVYQDGYYVENTKYYWESNLYDMKTQQLVYSVQTQSFDPADTESLGHEYGKLIIMDMVTKGVLAGHKSGENNGR